MSWTVVVPPERETQKPVLNRMEHCSPRSLNKHSSDCCKSLITFQNWEMVDFDNFCQFSCRFYGKVGFQRPLVCHSYQCPSNVPRSWHGLFPHSHPDNFPLKGLLLKECYKFCQSFPIKINSWQPLCQHSSLLLRWS